MEEIKRQKHERFKYSEEDLKKAILAVQQKEMSLCKASTSFNIPKGALSNKLCKKVPLERKMEPKTYLSTEEEIRMKNWILIVKYEEEYFPGEIVKKKITNIKFV